MNKKALVAIALLILAMLIAVLIAVFGGEKNRTAYSVYDVVLDNAQYSAVTPDGEIRFFTGTSIASYNPKTDTTKSLTREFPISFATEVRWNPAADKALIQLETKNLGASLRSKVNKDVVWWELSVTKDSLEPLSCSIPDATTTGAGWSETGKAILICSKTANNERRSSLSDRDELLASNLTPKKLIYATGDAYTILDGDTIYHHSKGGNSYVKGASNVSSAVVIGEKLYMRVKMGDEGSGVDSRLYVSDAYNSTKTKQYDKKLSVGPISLLQQRIAAIGLSPDVVTNKRYALIDVDGEAQEIDLKNNPGITEEALVGVIRQGNVLYVLMSNGSLYQAAQKESSLQSLASGPSGGFADEEFEVPGGVVSYDVLSNVATVSMREPESEANYKNVLAIMKEMGADPNQMTKRWVFAE